MNRAHRIRLSPTAAQQEAFAQHAGFARVAYNWAVGEFSASLRAVDDWNAHHQLGARFNKVKYIIYPWCRELRKSAGTGGIKDAQYAIERWRKSFRGGARSGFPKFKKRGRRQAFRVDNGQWYNMPKFDGKAILLPKAMGGRVRMRQELRYPNARVTSVRISKRAGHWYASVSVDDGLPLPPIVDNGKPHIGIDVGLKSLAVCSDGVIYDSPKPLARYLRKLRQASKSLSRKQKGSSNWHKQVEALQRVHAKAADTRNDSLHKLTTAIVSRAGQVSVEDLNVAGLGRSRLARSIHDAGWGELLRQLEYKCAWAGIPFRRVDRFYPSSKLCNACGWRNAELTLRDREWWCGGCGVLVDRDLNAARNIRDYTAVSSTVSACGDSIRLPSEVAAVYEAGTF